MEIDIKNGFLLTECEMVNRKEFEMGIDNPETSWDLTRINLDLVGGFRVFNGEEDDDIERLIVYVGGVDYVIKSTMKEFEGVLEHYYNENQII